MTSHHDSYITSISNFVRWAADRIEKEIETNERCEKQHGTAEIFKEHLRLPNKLSDKDKHNYIKKVERTAKENPSLTREAQCALNGIHFTTFYNWRKQLKKKGIIQ